LQQSTHALRQTRPDAYREMLETNRRPGQQEPWDIL
jgi:hypothetical protein